MSGQLKDSAKLRGEARSAQVSVKVRDAMGAIQDEIKENEGVYPKNGGAVSMNEVARRAKISETTLFSPKQKALGQEVKAWVESLKKKEVVGRMRVRRTFYERAEDWRKKFLALKDSHIVTELELQDTQVQLEKALDECATLRAENASLLDRIHSTGTSKVTSLLKRK
ncbi:MAG: hypothetical protein EOP06_16420 [Proteobacteria bacterium]|nr:MAG: hypothetical protein EOP06_16420 [Pseudomonadota bacterium]